MELSLQVDDFKLYLENQLENFFPDKMTHKYFKGNDASIAFKTAIERTENSFKHIKLCAYSDDSGQTFLSHLH